MTGTVGIPSHRLSLHLLQNCMVFVNTLMLQQVLARPHWAQRLTARDRHALTPLFCKRRLTGTLRTG